MTEICTMGKMVCNMITLCTVHTVFYETCLNGYQNILHEMTRPLALHYGVHFVLKLVI